MVVIASMIGVQGLGQPVLKAIANQYFTLGIFNGFAIVGIAIIFDRISQAYGSGCRSTGASAHGLNGRASGSRSADLYKIFGRSPATYVACRQKRPVEAGAATALRPDPCAEQHQHLDASGQDPGHHGPVRLRQVDAHPPHQPADRADIRRRSLSTAPTSSRWAKLELRAIPTKSHRNGLPEIRPSAAPDRYRECDLRPRDPGMPKG